MTEMVRVIHPRPITEREKYSILESITNDIKSLKAAEHKETQASSRKFYQKAIRQKEALHAEVNAW